MNSVEETPASLFLPLPSVIARRTHRLLGWERLILVPGLTVRQYSYGMLNKKIVAMGNIYLSFGLISAVGKEVGD